MIGVVTVNSRGIKDGQKRYKNEVDHTAITGL